MALNSLPFAGFLLAVYLLFRLVPAAFRAGLLLVASAVFISWSSPASAALLLAVALISYYGAKWLERLAERPARQQAILSLLVGSLVAVLIFCKYSPLRSAAAALGHFAVTGHWDFLEVALPVGCSFFLFQGIGYLVDTAWGRPACQRLPEFLLFMGFFPKVLMGPIERADGLLAQILELRTARFSYDEFRTALLRFAWGLFKKVVIADRLALYVSEVFDHPASYSGIVVIVAAILYPLQLLADFSGYSDMAIGCALRRISSFPMPPKIFRNSGGAGTSRFRRGFPPLFSRPCAWPGAGGRKPG
jgi:alginate O-acetyltransferase complex protein AlgI